MRTTILSTFSALFLLVVFYSCTPRTQKDILKESIIPKPESITATNSSFLLTEKTKIYYQASSEELKWIGEYITGILNPSTGFSLQAQAIDLGSIDESIYIALVDGESNLGDEGYEISITENTVILTAQTPEGVFRGVQTLRQLLPAKIESSEQQKGPWEIATGTIKDKPTYAYRGAMLDVARHFFDVKDVKRYIDLIAAYKLNTLHLHLSDDQGWRIEIKSWPNLTAHGGSTQVGGDKGGFYTQEEYKEIIKYAEQRYITVIPEIDMPGHTNAALASYAELNCDGKATELYSGIEVGFSTLCTDKEITYTFVDDVIRELAEMTPGPYIHIGGDESHATPLEDYIPFVNRVQQIVLKYDKKVMGWDEIANAKLIPNSVVQYWAVAENALTGIDKGAKVLISPATRTYLDMQYDSTSLFGLHWAAYIEVDEAYNWDPATIVPGIEKEHILGVESPLWSETVTNMDEIEYLVFPRIVGHAEIGWTESSKRGWDDYKVRLGNHCQRFEAMGINYYPSKLVPWN